jgi:hypothetical protein
MRIGNMAGTIPQKTLYQRDFVAWCDETLAKLKAKAVDELDFEGLIEEVEGLANRERKELESRLDVLLAHLLKRIYVPQPYDYRGWENTIREQRRQLQILLKHSPSLRNYLMDVFDDAWEYASKDVCANYPQVQFPTEWQFSRDVETLLSAELWVVDRDFE